MKVPRKRKLCTPLQIVFFSFAPTDSEEDGTYYTTYTHSPTIHEIPMWYVHRGLTYPMTWHHYLSDGEEDLSESFEELSSSDDSLAFLGDFSSDYSDQSSQSLFSTLFPSQSTPTCPQGKQDEEQDETPLLEAPDRWLDGLDTSYVQGLPDEECGDDSVFEDPDIIPPTPKRARHH